MWEYYIKYVCVCFFYGSMFSESEFAVFQNRIGSFTSLQFQRKRSMAEYIAAVCALHRHEYVIVFNISENITFEDGLNCTR